MLPLDDAKIGTDPEIFVRDLLSEREDQAVPAFFVLGTADDIPLTYGAVAPDGLAVEFTVEPSNDPALLSMYVHKNIADIARLIEQRSRDNPRIGGLFLTSTAYVSFKDIEALPPNFGNKASLQVFGCNRDYRVHAGMANPQRPNPRRHPWRTCGGHIHFEVPDHLVKHPIFLEMLVTACDMILGTYGTFSCPDKASIERKKLYGLAGTFRNEKTVEYRCLPSKALLATAQITEYVFSLAKKIRGAVVNLHPSMLMDAFGGVAGIQRCIQAIDQHDINVCRDIQKKVAEYLQHISRIDFMTEVNYLQTIEALPDTI